MKVDEEKSNEDYLKKCKVTENDPALLFDWHFEVLEQFVDGANQNVVAQPQAFFITTAPGNMTVTSLLNDLMILLSRVSGGRNGNNLLDDDRVLPPFCCFECFTSYSGWICQIVHFSSSKSSSGHLLFCFIKAVNLSYSLIVFNQVREVVEGWILFINNIYTIKRVYD